jgi:RNA polymerase sigma-70 factor (ECF subfamily)
MGRVSAGDQGAFAELFDRCAPSVLGFLVRFLRDPAKAEEVLQEVFLQIWQQAGAYRPEGISPRSWMIMLARHRAIDMLRSEISRTRREKTLYEDDPSHGAATPLGAVRIEEIERHEQIETALRGLLPDQRTCLELAFFEGLSHVDIARRLQAPLGTIKSRIRTGLRGMKRALMSEAHSTRWLAEMDCGMEQGTSLLAFR